MLTFLTWQFASQWQRNIWDDTLCGVCTSDILLQSVIVTAQQQRFCGSGTDIQSVVCVCTSHSSVITKGHKMQQACSACCKLWYFVYLEVRGQLQRNCFNDTLGGIYTANHVEHSAAPTMITQNTQWVFVAYCKLWFFVYLECKSQLQRNFFNDTLGGISTTNHEEHSAALTMITQNTQRVFAACCKLWFYLLLNLEVNYKETVLMIL